MTLTEKLIQKIGENNILQQKYLVNVLNNLKEDERNELEKIVVFFEKNGILLEDQVKSYLTFLNDTLEHTKYFVENKKYKYNSFEEVANSVYFNNEYMTKYMTGLTLSQYLWTNHLEMIRWFSEKIKGNRGKGYLEIGPGFGQYLLRSMKLTNYDKYEAIDISQTSVDVTKKIVEVHQSDKKFDIFCSDFLKYETDEKYDAVVMSEVLEHVEQPIEFLNKIYEISTNEAFIYVTTAINAPAIDHIYHFKTIEQVLELISDSKFKVKDYVYFTGNNISLEKAVKRNSAINIALILEK